MKKEFISSQEELEDLFTKFWNNNQVILDIKVRKPMNLTWKLLS